MPLCLFAANAADLDFLPGFLVGDPNRYHHGISHSVGFAILFASAFSLFLCMLKREIAPWWRTFAMLFCVYCSHIALDYLAVDSSFPHGVPAFWPVSGEYFISPIPIFHDIRRLPSAVEFIPSLFSLHNLRAVAVEVLFVLPFILLTLSRRIAPPVAHGGETPPQDSMPPAARL